MSSMMIKCFQSGKEVHATNTNFCGVEGHMCLPYSPKICVNSQADGAKEDTHNPQALQFLNAALSELTLKGVEEIDVVDMQFALHLIGRALVLLDPEHPDVQAFIEEDFYQIAAGAVKNRDVHMREHLAEGIKRLTLPK